ncbi:MAG TPA: LptF/LptG family permease, partial [Saprospiraceae bacterium]|nr:LptF/LptG family permease [Saprospiraceae bacterium]
PLALPIAVLLAGVMVMGNMAEKYELSSFKSAGVSLLRILLPLFSVSFLICLFSFYCSNTIIPLANLKYQSRLYDIRNQKPTLSIEPGVFNEDFRGYAIRVGKKHRDKETIEDIMVYDDTQRNRGQMNVVTAQKGKMYVSEEDGAFVMTLYDGYQYAESVAEGKPNSLPFTVSHFKEWTRRFDLGEFQLDRTEEDQFKSHHMMKSARQIAMELDTLAEQIALTKKENKTNYLLFGDSLSIRGERMVNLIDSSVNIGALINGPKKNLIFSLVDSSRTNVRYRALLHVLDSVKGDQNKSLAQSLTPFLLKEKKSEIISNITIQQSTVDRTERSLERLELTRRKHLYQLHWKFSLAVACIVMMMIGGPMGTIVRKGGFGYPLLVSIIFFTFFIMSNISCQKLNETKALPPVLAAWLPVLMLGLVSIVLTYKALNDAKVMDVDRIKTTFARLGRRRKLENA